jgi:hypothetical protein
MDKSGIRKEIASLINSIKEHSDNIGDKEHIPQIELELILHKIERLYQRSIVFNHLNSHPEANKTVVSTEKITAPVSEEPVKADVKKETVIIPESKPVDLFGSEVAPVTEKPKAEKKPEKKEEKREEKPVVSQIQRPAITDLTKAIGINDKFLFANELFGGNMQEYSIAIQQLNASGSLESAMDYFSNLQQLYEWDMEKETIKRLLDLVDRRYS